MYRKCNQKFRLTPVDGIDMCNKCVYMDDAAGLLITGRVCFPSLPYICSERDAYSALQDYRTPPRVPRYTHCFDRAAAAAVIVYIIY